jgi:IclR family acetate operon transcriptional repressor
MARRSAPPVRRGQVAERALQALEELADAPEGLGVSDLGRRLGVDKSTAHRLLATLQAREYVRLNPYTQRYVLGLRLIGLGAAAARGVDLAEIARPHLDALRDAAGEAASLAVLFEADALLLAKVVGPGVLTVNQGVGTRMPGHCSALGKVLVAGLVECDGPDVVGRLFGGRELVAHTPRSITDIEVLARHVEQVRHRGWALDDEEYAVGLRCLAAPVRDAGGEVVAAVGTSGPTTRVTLDRVEPVSRVVRETALAISTALGYRPPATNGTVHAG